MNMKYWVFWFLSFFLITTGLFSQEDGLTIVKVGEATLENDRVSFDLKKSDEPLSPKINEEMMNFKEIIKNDFQFYISKFQVEVKGPQTRYMVELFFSKNSKNSYHLKATVFDVRTKKNIGEFLENIHLPVQRSEAHFVADKIYKSITGKNAVFTSKIVFVSDRESSGSGSRRKSIKELYIMDFDGFNKKQLTNHKGLVIGPSINFDGTKILYALIPAGSGVKNLNLYMLDLNTRKIELISNRDGLNTGAVFVPNSNDIVLTLSHTGNAELYRMNLLTKELKRITNHFASDVDPSISYDGNILAFLSNRPGKAMIYTLDPHGLEKNVSRISYVGQYNSSPRFSWDGLEIAFSSWLDDRFDIFKINANGHGLVRLTKNMGSNEDPTWSFDGEFIAFSSMKVLSTYRANQEIVLMTRDGEIIGPVTNNFGKSQSPRFTRPIVKDLDGLTP